MTNGGESNGDPSGSGSRGPEWPPGYVGGLNQVPETGLWINVDLTGLTRC